MKRLLVPALLVGFLVSAAAFATAGGQPVSGGVLGGGVLTYRTTTVDLSKRKGFVMEWAKGAPGVSFGWHLHRTPVAVVVTAGTLTLYDGADPSCKAKRYSAGQGFMEPANHTHLARNEGSKPVSLYATYIGVPPNWRANPTPLDAASKNPGNCPAGLR